MAFPKRSEITDDQFDRAGRYLTEQHQRNEQEIVLALSTENTDYSIDHLMLGASDLSLGKTWIENQLGLPAMDGGSHPGQGTRNALLGLADNCYLEVIAPDPTQVLSETLGEHLLGYKTPRLRTFAVRCSSFEDLVPRLAEFGFGHRIVKMSRETITGSLLSWRLLFVSGHPYGARMPFFIDWGQSPHPCRDLAVAGSLSQVAVRVTAEYRPFERLMRQLDLPVVVSQAAAGLVATIACQQNVINL